MSIAPTQTGARPTRETWPPRPYRWRITGGLIALVVSACVWHVLTDAASYQFIIRLHVDRHLLEQTLREWNWAPIIFVVLQTLQVIIAPIPGEVTGILGGFLFGERLGLLYSVVGTTLGSVAAFALGRRLGAHSMRALVSQETPERLSFIVGSKGTMLCLIVYLIPGFPKDVACYLFGMSPMPLWRFALISTLGRMPGMLLLSTQGAHVAAGRYLEILLLTALVIVAAPPLYYYRTRIIGWASRPRTRTRPTVQ